MRLRMPLRDIPGRVTTGGYILHAGLGKWRGTAEQAAGVHRMASGAFPFLRSVPPERFLRLLAAAEIATGAALLLPVVPDVLAGAALASFSGGLLTMYLRTPTLHMERSIWPTPAGTAVSKDVWMLGVGLGLLAAGRATGEGSPGSGTVAAPPVEAARV
jgi:uncharacterized membrane protein YphA (DoxX/SURF4 family)